MREQKSRALSFIERLVLLGDGADLERRRFAFVNFRSVTCTVLDDPARRPRRHFAGAIAAQDHTVNRTRRQTGATNDSRDPRNYYRLLSGS